MTAVGQPAIVGTGFAVPPQVRYNDDPIFGSLRGQSNLFTGYQERHVLGPGETLTSIMVEAASAALVAAKLAPSDVDMVLGYGSVGDYVSPNTLAQVHAEMGLPSGATVLPFCDDFTNFNSALLIADALMRAGRIGNALIVCGDNWTQHVDYTTPQSVSAADGAGAAVVGPQTAPSQWVLVDHEQVTASQDYGAMYMPLDPALMQITAAGYADFGKFGMGQAPTAVSALLARNGLQPHDVTMIPHQASATLFESWTTTLEGITLLDTIAQYANCVLASIPITLASQGSAIGTDRLVLFGLGIQLHASALLLARAATTA